MADDFVARVSGIAMLKDPIRRSIYQFVASSAGLVSRDEVAAAAGIQRTLAVFHLDKLAEEGLLEVEFKRLTGRSGPGAGRPAKLYRRSPREIDVSLPAREYCLAAHLLAAAIVDASGRRGDVRASLGGAAREFGRGLGAEAERRSGPRASTSQRMIAMLEVLGEHGFEPRVLGNAIVLGNCPFHSLSQEFTDLVCKMNLSLMQGLRSEVAFADGTLSPRLKPAEGMCCVRFGDAA